MYYFWSEDNAEFYFLFVNLLPCLFQPILEVVKALAVGDVIDKHDCMGSKYIFVKHSSSQHLST